MVAAIMRVYEGKAAGAAAAPAYFIVRAWGGGKLQAIRDYRYARHVTEALLLN